MSPRQRVFLQWGAVVGFVAGLFLLFPPALVFVEMAARELRYFWWLILLVVLAAWLLWAGKKNSK